MTSEEQSGANPSASSGAPRRVGPQRRRRSFRPGRRPPRRPPSGQIERSAGASGQPSEQADLPETAAASTGERAEAIPESNTADAAPLPPLQDRQPNVSATPAIQEAIESVQRINKELETLLLEMQKALEILEEAEVQKYADEREIEGLRAAVRQLNRPREGQQRPHQPQGRPDQRNRHSHRDQRYQSSHRGRPEQRLPEKSPDPAPTEDHVEPRESENETDRDRPEDRDVPF